MNANQIHRFKAMPPAARYITMALTALPTNLPDGWTHVSLVALAKATGTTPMILRTALAHIRKSGLFDVRTLRRNGKLATDVRPTFLGEVRLADVHAV